MWTRKNNIAYFKPKGNEKAPIGFDLDWTLIRPKKGLFPSNSDDWIFMPGVRKKLAKLESFVIFTNQTEKKVEEVIKKIDIVFGGKAWVFIAIGYSVFRKPFPAMHDLYYKLSGTKIKIYCGDAAGRNGVKDDFSDSDYKFALNIDAKFLTEKQYFTNNETDNIHSSKVTTGKCLPYKPKKKEAIMMIGYPGSGKTTYAKKMNGNILSKKSLKTVTKVLRKATEMVTRGELVIFDDCNMTAKSREKYVKWAKQQKIKLKYVYIDATIEQAKYGYAVKLYKRYKSKKDIFKGVEYAGKAPPSVAYYSMRKHKNIPQDAIVVPFCVPNILFV